MTNTGTPWPNKAACTKRCRRTRIVELLGPQPKPPSSATAASSPPADSALLNDGALPGEQTDVTGIIEHVDAAGNFAGVAPGFRTGWVCDHATGVAS